MAKYIINDNFHGYTKTTVDELGVANENDNTLVLVIDKSCDNKLPETYKFINTAMKKNNRIILISVDDSNKSFKPLASLMVTYGRYDIYEVEEKDTLSCDYLAKLEAREPDYSEVQTFVGGDVVASSEMSTLIFGIESLVEEGNIDGLKSYVEENMISIENLTSVLNSMKKTCELYNSNELVNEINNLKNNEKRLTKSLDERSKELDSIKADINDSNSNIENLKAENSKLKEKNKELMSNNEQGGNTIVNFKTVQTQLLKGNKTKIVLYFKEISYVRYTNTLVSILMEYIKRKELKAKMLIYDANSSMYSVYNPLRVINGTDYVNDKSSLIHKVEKIVVAEPAQMIIEDMLTSDEAFDVIIIYDRMHSLNDIVEGNLVTKFFVLNSRQDYEKLKPQLKMNDTSFIITDAANSINMSKDWKEVGERAFLDIPTINDFKRHEIMSESFAFSKYIRQSTAITKQPLIETILSKSKINTLYNS